MGGLEAYRFIRVLTGLNRIDTFEIPDRGPKSGGEKGAEDEAKVGAETLKWEVGY